MKQNRKLTGGCENITLDSSSDKWGSGVGDETEWVGIPVVAALEQLEKIHWKVKLLEGRLSDLLSAPLSVVVPLVCHCLPLLVDNLECLKTRKFSLSSHLRTGDSAYPDHRAKAKAGSVTSQVNLVPYLNQLSLLSPAPWQRTARTIVCKHVT